MGIISKSLLPASEASGKSPSPDPYASATSKSSRAKHYLKRKYIDIVGAKRSKSVA